MNDDWVARLLAETERPVMPADVVDRLERTVRAQITGTTDGSTASPEPVAPPVPAAPRVPSAPSVPTTPAATTPPRPGPAPADQPLPAAARATDGVPPAAAPSSAGRPGSVVPPTAGAATSVRPLRAGGDDGAPGDDELARARANRVDGTSRREQRADDQGERRRRLLGRWVPVAAGVLVLGAAGATAVQVLGGSGAGGTEAVTAEEASAGEAAAEAVLPRSLVATGTEYTTADPDAFAQQVRDLVAVTSDVAASAPGAAAPAPSDAAAPAESDAAGDAGAAPASPEALADAGPDPAAARAQAEDSPLADPAALTECILEVTDGADESAAAVDLAVVDGVESTVVVIPDPAGTSLFVYVVGPQCSAVDTQFDFFTVTP